MACKGVSGKTEAQIEELRVEFEERNLSQDFEQFYCLAEIPNQPDDYEGPQRYCSYNNTHQIGDSWRCRYHGGKGHGNPEKMEKLAAMKHGMNATREHLVEDFDEKDEALYDWIMETYPRAYDIEIDDDVDPASHYDLHRLAAEIVRAERGRGFLLREGEIHEKKVRNDEGRIVTDENGDVVTEKSEHYLAKMMHRQDKKITKLEKELGITRKEQLRRDQTDDAVDAIKGFSEVGAKLLSRDENSYDPDDKPWEDDEGGSDGE